MIFISHTSKCYLFFLVHFWSSLPQGYFQHNLWPQCELLDGHCNKISSWKLEWFTWTDKGVKIVPEVTCKECHSKYWTEFIKRWRVYILWHGLIFLTTRLIRLKYSGMNTKLLECRRWGLFTYFAYQTI